MRMQRNILKLKAPYTNWHWTTIHVWIWKGQGWIQDLMDDTLTEDHHHH